MVQYEAFRVAAQKYHRRVAAGGDGSGFNLKGKSHIKIEGIGFTSPGGGRYVLDVPSPSGED